MGPLVVVCIPDAVAVRVTLRVQDEAAGIAPPERLMVPFAVLRVTVPPHVFVYPVALAIANPAGSVSLKVSPLTEDVAFVFVTVKLKDVVPFCGTAAAPNDIAKESCVSTDMLAVAGFPASPCIQLKALVVLVCIPVAIAVTFTPNVQDPLALRVPPVKTMLFVPEVAVIVPVPQLPLNAFGFATISPDGNVSVNPMPVSGIESGFVIVKLRLVVPFIGMPLAPKVMVSTGGPITVIVAEPPGPLPASLDEIVVIELF